MSSKYDDLEKLADLKNKGIITEEEFKIKKAQILNQDDNTQDNVHEPIQSDNNGTWQSIKQSPVVENKITYNAAKIIGAIINVIIFIGIIVLVTTNPTKADFQNYVSNRMQKNSANTEDPANKFFSALASLAMNQITERDNYFVCSIYTVNTTFFKVFSDKVPNNPKFLGIFGQFIPLNVELKDKEENVGQKSNVEPAPVPEVPPPVSTPPSTPTVTSVPNVKEERNTPYGTIRIMYDGEYLEINGQKIPKNDASFSIMDFGKEFQFSNSYVVLISGNCGGTACGFLNSYFFVTLKPDKSYSISETFDSETKYKLQQQGETITLQFDRIYPDDLKEYYEGAMTVIYKDGKVKILKEESHKRSENQKNGKYRLKKDDCDWLYGQVLDGCLSQNCEDMSFLGFGADNIYALHDTGLDTEKFTILCKQVCKSKQKPSRTAFGNSICERK